VTLNVSVDGRKRHLKKAICEEAFFVVKEAMLNAYRHSGGSLLTVHLNYRSDVLTLQVKDNGRGIDPAILDSGEKPEHWGMVGMRERAQQMSAKFSIESTPGNGTRVTLCIPARIAYAASPKAVRFLWSKHHATAV
jgi:signal transduction histidine kinase